MGLDELVRRSPTSSPSTCRRRPRRSGSSARTCWRGPSPGCASSTPPAAASSTRRRSPTPSATGTSRAPPSTCSPRSRCTSSPLFELDSVVVTPAPRGQHARGAGQGGRHHRRAGAARARRRLRALRGQRRARRRRRRRCGRSCRWPSGSARCSPSLNEGVPVGARGRVPGPARRLRHPHPHPVGAEGPVRRRERRAGVLRQRAAARRGARHRRAGDDARHTRTTTSTSSRCAAAATALAGTLAGLRGRAAHRDARRPHRRGAAGPPHARRAQRRPAGDDRHRAAPCSATPASTSPTCTSAARPTARRPSWCSPLDEPAPPDVLEQLRRRRRASVQVSVLT